MSEASATQENLHLFSGGNFLAGYEVDVIEVTDFRLDPIGENGAHISCAFLYSLYSKDSLSFFIICTTYTTDNYPYISLIPYFPYIPNITVIFHTVYSLYSINSIYF